MKLIHCSDLHLDSRMETHLTAGQAKERNAEICTTFARMVRFAVENGVDAVLIAGDLFDTDRTSARTAAYVMDQICSAPGMDFLYLRGNHDGNRDPFDGMTLPSNFKTFGNNWKYFDYGNVTVAGLEMDRDNWLKMYDSLSLPPDRINIVMLHGQISTQPGEDMIDLGRLRNRRISYLALGHLHSFRQGVLDPESLYCYCGCLEGRGFDECGEKGFVLINAENGIIKTKFIPFASRMLLQIPVDLTGLETVSQILHAMEQASAGISPRSLVRFMLRGYYTLQTQKDLEFLRKGMEQHFYHVSIRDESRLRISREFYEHDASLKGEFIRLVMNSDRSEQEKEKIICCGIQALSGEEITL